MRALAFSLVTVVLGATLAPWCALAGPLPPGTPLCGFRQGPPPTYQHVVWIWMENHSYDSIVGAGDAPFVNRTLIAGCGLATNAHNITHPSLPNYIAATSGLPPAALGRFKSDCNAVGGCTTGAPSLFGQMSSWKAYEESMRKPCTHVFTGLYAASHNPPAYYRSLTDCAARDVPYFQLEQDLQADTLPAFVFITPNMCDNMHNCSVGTGDAWLARNVSKIVTSPAYQNGTTAVFVTWDEGRDGSSDRCAHNTSDSGCHIATIVISPYTVPGTRSSTLFNHYALLRTTEEMLGVGLLGKAATANSMRAAFNL